MCASTGGIGLEARLYDSAARRVFAVRDEGDLLKLLRFVNSSKVCCAIVSWDLLGRFAIDVLRVSSITIHDCLKVLLTL